MRRLLGRVRACAGSTCLRRQLVGRPRPPRVHLRHVHPKGGSRPATQNHANGVPPPTPRGTVGKLRAGEAESGLGRTSSLGWRCSDPAVSRCPEDVVSGQPTVRAVSFTADLGSGLTPTPLAICLEGPKEPHGRNWGEAGQQEPPSTAAQCGARAAGSQWGSSGNPRRQSRDGHRTLRGTPCRPPLDGDPSALIVGRMTGLRMKKSPCLQGGGHLGLWRGWGAGQSPGCPASVMAAGGRRCGGPSCRTGERQPRLRTRGLGSGGEAGAPTCPDPIQGHPRT
uniref:Uncharacterized protein LOC112818788 n=1 Tax=Callorhinus ursinus TaxID=34884 RepID=A0A3Q7NKN6_CALUR|nr:uncharacterized protein LOC112818788 [Callorhinus ursinus]